MAHLPPRSDNALNPGGAAAIKPLLANCLSLEELNLNNTGVGPAGGQVSIRRHGTALNLN